MRNFIMFKLYLRELRNQKKRIRLTIGAIIWGTIAIILLSGFGKGLKDQMIKSERGLGTNIVIVWPGQTSKVYEGLPQGRRLAFTEDDAWSVKKAIPEISRLSPEYMTWGMTVRYKDNEYNISCSGVYPQYEDIRSHFPEYKGRFINDSDIKHKRRVIFLGFALKEKIFGKEDAVGKQIFVNDLPFTVVGVMNYKLQMSSYTIQDKERAIIPATTFKTMYGYKYISNFVYQLEDPTLWKYVQKRMYSVLSHRLKFAPDDKMALSIWDTIEDRKIMAGILTGINIFLGFIGAMTLLIAGVGVANIVYVSVKERTREIGIKMALGAKSRDIMRQIILEAMFISFLGGFLGIVVSFLLVKGIQAIPVTSENLQLLGKPVFSANIAIITVSILSIIGFFAGFFPARKASQVEPVEALHYE